MLGALVLAWTAVAWPAGAEKKEIAGCEAFYAPAAIPEKPIVVPCGRRSDFTPGRYLIWIEQNATISATPVWRAIDSATKSETVHAMTGAGRISTAAPASDQTTIRYVHLSPASHAFTRVVSGSRANQHTAMPAGRVAGGIFDRKSGDAVALFHSVSIATGVMTVIEPKKPVGSSDVFVELIPPADRAVAVPEITLEVNGTAIHPDDFVDGGDRIYGVWYGIHGDAARVLVPSGDLWYYGRDLILSPGRVTTLRGELKLKPRVDVTVHLHGSEAPEMFVDVHRIGDKTPLRHVAIRSGETKAIESLTPERFELFLRLSSWKVRKSVDLSDGRDASIVFELKPIAITGTVKHGRDPAAATIGFQDYDGWIEVETDDSGAYHTTLWTPRDYLTRVLLRGETTPFVDLKRIYDSGVYDFDLPRSRYVVRVHNAKTGDPIAAAQVTFENVWKSDQYGEQNAFLTATTDGAGAAVLPPLRPGTVSVRAEAKGFQRSEFHKEPVENDAERTIEIALEPVSEAATLRLVLPDATPADGAEVIAMPRAGEEVLWRGTSGADGSVELPRLPDGAILMVRHAKAASAARPWTNIDAEWHLTEAAPPLTIRIETSPDTVRAAQVAAWIDGSRMTGLRLAFLTWSVPVSSRDGVWIARNLPRSPIRILAWRKADPSAIATGAYDALATQLNYPWPQAATIVPID
jgi:hypothetical protein